MNMTTAGWHTNHTTHWSQGFVGTAGGNGSACSGAPPSSGPRTRMRGLSLVELMVALLISSLIMIGLVQVFVSSKGTYQMDEGLARLQENGRFALDFLAHDIRMAGHKGCMGYIPPSKLADKVVNYLPSPGPGTALNYAVQGFEADNTIPSQTFSLPSLYPAPATAVTSPPLDPALVPVAGVVPGSDVLAMVYMDPSGYNLVANASNQHSDAANVFVQNGSLINKNDTVMVADCTHVGIFKVTDVTPDASGLWTNLAHAQTDSSGNAANICTNWGTGCKDFVPGDGAQVTQLRTAAYYVGPGTYGGPSLFRIDSNAGAVPQELVEGVENLQILYGLNTTGACPVPATPQYCNNVEDYVPANLVTDWTQVVSVRIAMLVATSNVTGHTDNAPDTTASYPVNSVNIVPPANDLHRRRVFTATISLRNHKM